MRVVLRMLVCMRCRQSLQSGGRPFAPGLRDCIVIVAVKHAVAVKPQGNPAPFFRREFHAVMSRFQQAQQFGGPRTHLARNAVGGLVALQPDKITAVQRPGERFQPAKGLRPSIFYKDVPGKAGRVAAGIVTGKAVRVKYGLHQPGELQGVGPVRFGCQFGGRFPQGQRRPGRERR